MSGGVEDFHIGPESNLHFDFIVGHVYKVVAEWYEDQEARIEDGSPCAEITKAEFCFPGTCMKSCFPSRTRTPTLQPAFLQTLLQSRITLRF